MATDTISNVAFDNTTLANFKSWGQAPGTALLAFGWSIDSTVNGVVNWSTLTYTPTQSNQTDFFGGFTLPAFATTNSRGAWSNASVTYAINDYVTYNGATWICRSGYTTSGNSSTPTPDQDNTHWVLWVFEVWISATTPTIYLRLEYTGQTSNTNVPRMRIAVATNDNTSANMGVGAGQQVIVNDINGTTSGYTARPNIEFLCYFSGDSGNRFGMMMWAQADDIGTTGVNATGFFCVERSLSSSGAYYTTPSGAVTPYWTAVWSGYSVVNFQQSIVNTTGTTWILTNSEIHPTTASVFLLHNTNPDNALSLSQIATAFENQGYPGANAFPIWPLVGWVGNPMTAVMTFKAAFVTDAPYNASFTTLLYGSTRTYISSYNASSFANFGTGSSINNGLAMRFD